ncbi:hypothetical protein AE938_15615 [Bacteroides fragilis]|nr:hypothetical protein [Bacteroides fragilis]
MEKGEVSQSVVKRAFARLFFLTGTCNPVRKEWDSNPRNRQAVHRISSPAHSITLASFLKCTTKVNRFMIRCSGKGVFFFLPGFCCYFMRLRVYY